MNNGCPKCHTTHTVNRPDGIGLMYECGYWQSFQSGGKCKAERPAYEQRSPMMKPRIRIIFDKYRSPEEVRVIISAPTRNTQTYDEFNGLIIVEADEKAGTVNTICLKCDLLGGKERAGRLLELVATFDMHEYSVNKGIEAILAECRELLGKEAIQAKVNDIKAGIKKKLHGLYPIVTYMLKQQGHNKDYDDLDEKLSTYYERHPKRALESAKATIEYLIDRFMTAGSLQYWGSDSISVIIRAMPNELFFEFLEDCAKNPCVSDVWASALSYLIVDEDLSDEGRFNKLKHYYQMLLKASEDKKKQAALMRYHLISTTYSAILDNPETAAPITEWLKEIRDNDPDKRCAQTAKSYVKHVELEDDEDEGIWDELDMPMPNDPEADIAHEMPVAVAVKAKKPAVFNSVADVFNGEAAVFNEGE